MLVCAVVTDRSGDRDGLLITRHLDYSLPYRTLLSGRGMTIPYLGERLLDALVGLLVRLHLAGFFWGDCSLSNTLFRRDAGLLQAYIIDVETSERYPELSAGQRQLDLDIATENVAGGLLDLQAGGRLVGDIDPWQIASNLEARYGSLWDELTGIEEFDSTELWRIEQRIRRLHDLGFDVGEMEVHTDDVVAAPAHRPPGRRERLPPGAAARAHRPVGGGEPGPPAPRRHPRLRCRAPGPHGDRAAGEHRGRALARPALRADDRGDPAGADRQAAGRGDLPPAARAPLVRERAAAARRVARRGARHVHPRRAGAGARRAPRARLADRRAVPR